MCVFFFFSSMVTGSVSGNTVRTMLELRGSRKDGVCLGSEMECVVTEEPCRHCWPPVDSTVRWKQTKLLLLLLHTL